jgi:hypothetical protein
LSVARLGRGLVAAVCATLLPLPAVAEGLEGIGFAQAEEGTWWCRGETVDAALDCARQQCLAESGGQQCHATRWCYPAGWSALMVVWLPEFHATHILCGMPGPEAAAAAMQAICEAGAEFSRCDLVLHIDPQGKEIDVAGPSWPGGATIDSEAVTAPQ